jgi:protein SCO1
MIGRRGFLLGAASFALVGGAAAQRREADPLAGRFGGPFQLTDHTGKRVTERDFLGSFMLVYFGFTRCVDACPIDMPNLVHALEDIAPLDQRVRPVFITVDPDDTPELLSAYVSSLHPRLVGLTGSDAELSAVARAYRVHRYRVERQSRTGPRFWAAPPDRVHEAHGDKPHSPGQRFTINHGTLTYLMGRDGRFLTLVPHGEKPKRIADILRKYVSG